MITKEELIAALKKEYNEKGKPEYEPEIDCVDATIKAMKNRLKFSKLFIDVDTAIFIYNCKQIDKHIGF